MFTKKNFPLFFALFISIGFSLAGSIVSVLRFWQYEVFYYDFGIFDRAIWSVSRFAPPYVHHMIFGEKLIFADHFSPSIFLLSPLYWIIQRSEIVLVAQAFAVGISGFVLFLIGKHILKNNRYAIALMLVYFLFTGLQNAVITDFHELTISTLFFMLTFLFIVEKKVKLFFLCFLLFLGCKETMFLPGIGIAIATLFIQPQWKKIAAITFFLSIAWGLLTIKVIIPHFSGGFYLYASQVPTNPILIANSFFDEEIKRQTLFKTFASFGFLPILSPAFWFLIFQDFLARFYPDFPTRWGLGFHYSALTASIMAVASVYSLSFLQKKIGKKILNFFVILLVINAAFFYRVVLRGPFALAYNKAFYAHTKDFGFLSGVIKLVPKNATIMTQNNLAPHFTHQKVWLLISDMKAYKTEYYKFKMPDYILLDNRSGQNPNDYFGVVDMNILVKHLKEDSHYKLIYDKNGQMLFKRE